MILQLIFYFFSALLVFAATMVITVRNPVHAALFLVLAFFSSSAIWLLLEAEFLAIALVLVYVGAVMVLFLFVVMMLDVNLTQIKEGFTNYLPLGIGVAVLMMVAMITIVGADNFGLDKVTAPARHLMDYNNTAELGRVLYTDYVYPFEIASVILLVAIIAAISLTMRPRRQTKAQKPEEQVLVRSMDRVRIIKDMEAEKGGRS
jgi:NADH-quinone oxidoreductase subunit J